MEEGVGGRCLCLSGPFPMPSGLPVPHPQPAGLTGAPHQMQPFLAVSGHLGLTQKVQVPVYQCGAKLVLGE